MQLSTSEALVLFLSPVVIVVVTYIFFRAGIFGPPEFPDRAPHGVDDL